VKNIEKKRPTENSADIGFPVDRQLQRFKSQDYHLKFYQILLLFLIIVCAALNTDHQASIL
jgi:hypothetical protein